MHTLCYICKKRSAEFLRRASGQRLCKACLHELIVTYIASEILKFRGISENVNVLVDYLQPMTFAKALARSFKRARIEGKVNLFYTHDLSAEFIEAIRNACRGVNLVSVRKTLNVLETAVRLSREFGRVIVVYPAELIARDIIELLMEKRVSSLRLVGASLKLGRPLILAMRKVTLEDLLAIGENVRVDVKDTVMKWVLKYVEGTPTLPFSTMSTLEQLADVLPKATTV